MHVYPTDCEAMTRLSRHATFTNTRELRDDAKSHGVVANPVAFWGQRPRFESWWDYTGLAIRTSGGDSRKFESWWDYFSAFYA